MFSILRRHEKVFISYSHDDAWFVKPYVDFLRHLSGSEVFFDQENIPAGERWNIVIERAINDADRVAVFWSKNSAASEEVRKEYKAAISAKKRVIPTLLDSTPLPADLRDFQWHDMRNDVRLTYTAEDIHKNALLRDPDVYKRMARSFLQFLAEERRRAR